MSTTEDQLKHKLALIVLGVIVGAGTYSLAKTIVTPNKSLTSKDERK